MCLAFLGGLLTLEDEGITFPWDAENHSHSDKALYLRRPDFSEVALWEPEVSGILIYVILRENLDEEEMFWREEKSLTPSGILTLDRSHFTL